MMSVPNPWRAGLLAGLIAFMLSAPAGPASAELVIKGDQAAWQEIQTAYGKLKELQGYRMKSDMGRGTGMVVEVAAGGTNMHIMMHSPGGNVESYVVNGQTRMKNDMAGAMPGWHCYGSQSPMMSEPPDPSKIQGTVDVARSPDTTIDGQPVHAYTYTFTQHGQSTKQTLYVGAANGLPRRIVVATPRGDQAMDYYDYDTPITLTPPACK